MGIIHRQRFHDTKFTGIYGEKSIRVYGEKINPATDYKEIVARHDQLLYEEIRHIEEKKEFTISCTCCCNSYALHSLFRMIFFISLLVIFVLVLRQ